MVIGSAGTGGCCAHARITIWPAMQTAVATALLATCQHSSAARSTMIKVLLQKVKDAVVFSELPDACNAT